jgi:hypothetical protein
VALSLRTRIAFINFAAFRLCSWPPLSLSLSRLLSHFLSFSLSSLKVIIRSHFSLSPSLYLMSSRLSPYTMAQRINNNVVSHLRLFTTDHCWTLSRTVNVPPLISTCFYSRRFNIARPHLPHTTYPAASCQLTAGGNAALWSGTTLAHSCAWPLSTWRGRGGSSYATVCRGSLW